MEVLQRELEQKAHPLIYSQILCFNSWKDPEDFFTMTRGERHKLMHKYRHLAVPATNENIWVWFGSYGGRSSAPRYNNDPVSRYLYQLFISPADNKRIVPTWVTTRAEVNPHKFTKAIGMTLQQKLKHYEQMTGRTPPHKAPDNLDEKLIQLCLEEMTEFFYPDVIDTKEEMAKVMLKNGHTEFAIAEAFKLSKLEWVTPSLPAQE